MGNVVSIIVVTVFLVIVFRKRLAPLFKGRKQEEKAETAAAAFTAETVPGPDPFNERNVYVHVFAIDSSRYSSMHDLSDAIETNLYDRLAKIYNDYVGSFAGLDVITVNGIMVFLIRWHT